MATEDLEDLIKDDSFLSFDPDCVRKRANWSKASDAFKFDSGKFDPPELLNAIPERSPKLQTLLQKIEELDRADMAKDGHLYKHFIFCDLKSSTYGAKLLASALLAKGMVLGYDALLGGRPKSPSLSPILSPPKQITRRKKPRKQSTPKRLLPIKKQSMRTPTAEFENTANIVETPFANLDEDPGSLSLSPSIALEPKVGPNSSIPPPPPPTLEPGLDEGQLDEDLEQPLEEDLEQPLEEDLEQPLEEDLEQQVGGAGKKAKIFGKIQVLSDRMLNSNPYNNFFLLSSVTVFDQPISVATKKQILQKFNQRPENVFGQEARIIVMDSGFKEGIDLFDIKYIHIFEPPVNAADQKQVIGRGTRLCGQKGLVFHPTQGWPLHVFVYDLDIPDKMQSAFLGATTAFDLYLKAMNLDIRLFRFAADLEEVSIYGSVDYELNRKIHDFAIARNNSPKQTIPAAGGGGGGGGAVKMSGGGPKKARIIIDRTIPPIMVKSGGDSLALMGSENSPQLQVRLPSGQLISGVELKQMNFKEMRKYIKHYFGDLSWSDVQMENMCIDKSDVKGLNPKQKGGASTVIKYTPTQDFVRRYFTPQAPVKGMLLWHSVGTGKTCSAIAAASSSFEPQNYTILWVTRTTLKNDIWKNMFDQICSEVMKRKLEELEKQGLSMPEVQAKRMRLLSKNWSIRPMSYKQFSNLVSKENNFYKSLVKINGPADPLRKTLLVIDEAHKLYGGGDLSSLERPDMKALHAALMNSYAVSGPDSVRLLLMTATPITENPMELIKLMNLCKLPDQQMPTEFPLFSQEFLDEEGGFTAEGRHKYLDAIAGHISYLNREKDARQFSQPRIQAVRSPLIRDVQDAMDLDKRFARSILNKEVDDLKVQIKAENDKIDADLRDLDPSRFYGLRDKCDDMEGKEKKACLKIANANIRQLVQEVKAHTGQIKDAMKEIKEEVKNKNLFRKTALKNISDRLKDNPQQLEKFREGMFYSLKYKCGKKITPNTALKEAANTHPDLIGINREIEAYGERLAKLDQTVKTRLLAHNSQIKSIKQMLRTGNLNELERGVLNLSLKDIRKTFTQRSKVANKLAEEERKHINTTRKALEKNRKHQLNRLKKTVKTQVKEQKSEARDTTKAATKLRKTMRKQGELREEIKHELLLDLMKKYSGKVDDDFANMRAGIAAKVEEGRMKKAAKTEEKAKIKETKMAAKQEEKAVKLVAKQEEKAKMKEAKALDRADAKEAIKLARETRKAADKAAKMVEKLEEKAKKAEAKKEARRTKKNRD